MLRLRKSTQFLGLRPELFPAMLVCDGYFRDLEVDWYIISAVDGAHSPASSHYRGCALRLDILDAGEEDFLDYASDLSEALSRDYTVTADISHLTIEYTPLKGVNN